MKKIKSLLTLSIVCGAFAFGTKQATLVNDSNAWVGVGYLYSENGGSNGGAAAIGAYGTVNSTLTGAAAAGMWGGPVGMGVGILVGL